MIKKINKKIIFAFFTVAVIFGTLGAGATSLIYSKNITYDNTNSGLSSTTVQGALDELYEKAKNAPSCDSEGNCTVTCPNGKVFSATDNGYKCSNPKLSDVLTITKYEYDDMDGGFMNLTFSTTDNNIPLKITGYSNTSNSTDISTATMGRELSTNSSNTSISECWKWSGGRSYNFIVIEDTSGKYTGNVISNTIFVQGTPARCTY